jgi:hypothetical protein
MKKQSQSAPFGYMAIRRPRTSGSDSGFGGLGRSLDPENGKQSQSTLCGYIAGGPAGLGGALTWIGADSMLAGDDSVSLAIWVA